METTRNYKDVTGTKKFNSEEKKRDFLTQDVVFKGKNGEYEIKCNSYISCGGESLVYEATKIGGENEKLVAKIYDQIVVNIENNKKRKRINDFIIANSNYEETHLMPITDYGVVKINLFDDDDDVVEVSRYIDIVPYCEKGTLEGEKISFQRLHKEVIPSVFTAMSLLHKEGLIHRDIKPENICYLGKEDTIVLTDFGTATEIDKELSAGFTRERRGTDGYIAPEVQNGYATISADYYSLGATISTLYNGEHVHKKFLDNPSALNLEIKKKGFPFKTKAGEESIQYLVNALTAIDGDSRAGEKEVSKWLDDTSSIGHVIYNESKSRNPVNIDGTKCLDLEEIANALIEHDNVAKRYVYPFGGRRTGIIEDWLLANGHEPLAIKFREIMEAKDTAINQDLGVAKAIFYLLDKQTLVWKGNVFNKWSDITEWVESKEESKNEVNELLSSKYISWTIEQKDHKPEDLEKIKKLELLATSNPEIAYYYAKYIFPSADKQAKTFNGFENFDQIFEEVVSKNNLFYLEEESLLNDPEVIGFACYKKDSPDEIISYLEKEQLKEDRIYKFFEAVVEDSSIVRKHYIKFGPDAHYFWLLENLSLYNPTTSRAKSLINDMKQITVDETISITDMMVIIEENEYKFKQFVSYFNNNPLNIYAGFGGFDIVSSNSDAYFKARFMDRDVPIGFIKTLGIEG